MNPATLFPRRDFLKLASAGVLSAVGVPWFRAMAHEAAHQRRAAKACILLWMDGGPSQVDTFDPKPAASSDVRGTLGAIDTSVPGIQIGEHLLWPAILAAGIATRDDVAG